MQIKKYTVDIDPFFDALNALDVKPASRSYAAIRALNELRASICPKRALQDALDAFATSTIALRQCDETTTFEKNFYFGARAGAVVYIAFLCESYVAAMRSISSDFGKREIGRFLDEIIAPAKTPKEALGKFSNVVKAVGD